MSRKQTPIVLDPNPNPSSHELLIYVNHSTRDGLIMCLAFDNEGVGESWRESIKCTRHRRGLMFGFLLKDEYNTAVFCVLSTSA